MRYRVMCTVFEKHEAFVTDGDQDGDAWEGSKAAAEKLAREMRGESPKRLFPVDAHSIRRTYKVVPSR